MQGHCEDIASITVWQPGFETGELVQLFEPYQIDCASDVTVNDTLPICVFSLHETAVDIRYKLHKVYNFDFPPTEADTQNVTIWGIDCDRQDDMQRCLSPGGMTALCPDWGCLSTPDGPTELNFLVYFTEVQSILPDGTAELVAKDLFWDVGPLAAITGMSPAYPGCLWIPSVPEVYLTVAEGTCSIQNHQLRGKGCVSFTQQAVGCGHGECGVTKCELGQCATPLPWGRVLSMFDLNYLDEIADVSTVSVSLENSDCDPFRFKNEQGSNPRCYCVLPTFVRARIIEKFIQNGPSGAECCYCSNIVDCTVQHLDATADCSLCNFLSDLNFDLTGMPYDTSFQLFTTSYNGTLAEETQPEWLLRQYVWESGKIAKSVLRTGKLPDQRVAGAPDTPADCCHEQQYCVTVVDNAASKTCCVVCNDKECTPCEFTEDLCIDLEHSCSNTDGDEIEQGMTLDVSIYVHNDEGSCFEPLSDELAKDAASEGFVRTISKQGGVDGCDLKKKKANVGKAAASARVLKLKYDQERKIAEKRYIAEHDTSHLTAEELVDFRLHAAMSAHTEVAPRGLSVVAQSIYTVLKGVYDVFVHERELMFKADKNCIRGGYDCNFAEDCEVQKVLTCLCINTTCGGYAYNSTTKKNGGSIPADNIWVTLATLNGTQIRGPRGEWTQNSTTCTWSAPTFINASYGPIGMTHLCVPVLRAHLMVRVEEGLIAPSAPIWPDPREHPTVDVEVDCGSFGNCEATEQQIYSLWPIFSARGSPSRAANGGLLTFKFGKAQNVYREVPGTHLAVGSFGNQQNPATWNWAENYICQVADPRYEFRFSWGTYAFPDNRTVIDDVVESPFSCDTAIQPYPEHEFYWQDHMNFCAMCPPTDDDHVLNAVDDACRVSWVRPGSAGQNMFPLGVIYVNPFFHIGNDKK